jgi:hypothetical protein
MDFRLAPDPRVMTWAPPSGGARSSKSVFATFQGRKLRIQTPKCRCRMFRDGATSSLYLYSDDHEVQQDFLKYVTALEDYCSSLTYLRNCELSSCVRNETSVRLNVWESTEWFDLEGLHVPSPESLNACSCILEFTGCWLSAGQKFGLKWKVVQVKEETPPGKPMEDFLDGDEVFPRWDTGGKCMFLDD